ncbi:MULTISPECIES: hypothetical protein [unclassified Pseudoalteromonas]|uniref:hypothetical protein n=1 Tax=unclassified Pseudoalteromonas TaxID=194690 RepID=UPI00386CCE57
MELISIGDVNAEVERLRAICGDKHKPYIRPVGLGSRIPNAHNEKPTTYSPDAIRNSDFKISSCGKYVEVSNQGLSYATKMGKIKSIISLKQKFFREIDIYSLEPHKIPNSLIIVNDRPGHASLKVRDRMLIEDLVKALEIVAKNSNYCGRLKV